MFERIVVGSGGLDNSHLVTKSSHAIARHN